MTRPRSAIRLIAPAKINWSLEVLRIRPDGYHEIRSVLQTIDLHDTVTLEPAGDISLVITGPTGGTLDDNAPGTNLAERAASVLAARIRAKTGVRIMLDKRIPVAAGLGGGSTDASAVLRGLNILWDAGQSDQNLMEIAGEVGSDPPFFIVGGTAMVSGRGEHVEPLDDALAPSILLATPPAGERAHKTAAMFGALTPEHYSEGDVSLGVREVVQARRMIVDADLNNVFERVTTRMQPETERAMDALRAEGYEPHLAGAGPSFFLLYPGGADLADELGRRIRDLGFQPRPTHVLPRARAIHVEES